MKHALRSLAKSPGFTVVAVLTLALGIGMNTAMFSMLNGFLLRPLSYPDADRLFRLNRFTTSQPYGGQAPANFLDLQRAGTEVADLAALRYWGYTLAEPGQAPDSPFAARVTANYFDVLGLRPQLGRNFLPGEDFPGQNNVAIISHEYWQSQFNGAPDIVGRTVRVDAAPTEIIGVMPADQNALRLTGTIELFRPMAFSEQERATRTDNNLTVIGRYRDGVTPTQAAAQFDALGRRLAADHPTENGGAELRIQSLQSTTLTGVGLTTTWLLVGLSGFVLLIACANLANLLLARAMSRAREFSIRGALGASRFQLIKPITTECFLLAATGCGAALLVASWTSAWLGRQYGGPSNPYDFSLDNRVLGFAIVASFVTAVLFGVAPAWWSTRVEINESLKGGSRGSTGTRSQQHYRQLLLAAQFGIALVLLAGAGFFIRGVDRLTHVESGWNPAGVITGSVNLASAKYNAAEPILAFHRELRDRLMALPGVANVSVSFEEPLFDAPAQRSYRVEGREAPKPGQDIVAYTNGVSASYFDTFGTHLLRGRLIDETDTLTSRPVVVINDAMARALFPQHDAVGHRLAVAGDEKPVWAEIVGVVEDVRSPRVRPSAIGFQVYKPFAQEAWQYVTIAVRATDPAKVASLLEPIRTNVAALDPDQPVSGLRPAAEKVALSAGFWVTIDRLLSLFAGLGLLLAALGIYGVTARLVAQRTTEIGIRMALGAQVRDIIRLVLSGGFRPVLAGAVFGLIGAVYLSHYLTRELPAFGGSSLLPVTAAAALLIIVALAASWLPARRAAKVDPLVALRAE